MNIYQTLLEKFIDLNKDILGGNLVGVYLHGSAAMGCFNPNKSDLDLIVVVNSELSDQIKHAYMDGVVKLNSIGPKQGIELSIVRQKVCRSFVYPTPFELHFSTSHLEWYKTDPEDYVEKMKGTDKDLAAHFTIINHRGEVLYGKEIKEVFDLENPEAYFDSIWSDVEFAETEIINNPLYLTLNLCRVLAYKREKLILSKLEGANWGIEHLPLEYRELIQQAIDDYTSDQPMALDEKDAIKFATYMINQIKN